MITAQIKTQLSIGCESSLISMFETLKLIKINSAEFLELIYGHLDAAVGIWFSVIAMINEIIKNIKFKVAC